MHTIKIITLAMIQALVDRGSLCSEMDWVGYFRERFGETLRLVNPMPILNFLEFIAERNPGWAIVDAVGWLNKIFRWDDRLTRLSNLVDRDLYYSKVDELHNSDLQRAARQIFEALEEATYKDSIRDYLPETSIEQARRMPDRGGIRAEQPERESSPDPEPTQPEPEPAPTTTGEGHLSMSDGSLVIFYNGRMLPVPPGHASRDLIAGCIAEGNYQRAADLADKHEAVARFLAEADGVKLVRDDYGQVLLDDQALPEVVANKAVAMLDADIEPGPLLRFLKLMQENPKEDIRRELLAFVADNDFCIDQDGYIVAWKKVVKKQDGTLTDPYTQQLDYTPPRTVTMPRDSVNPDPGVSCAPGLHFATWKFTKGYRAGDTIVELRVNPKDVVSVPDIHTSKGRACTFHIQWELDEVEQQSNTPPIPTHGIAASSPTARAGFQSS